MAGWRSLRAVLPNFLATFASRYTNRDGWWLFGLAERELHGLTVDLLAPPPEHTSPREQVVAEAILKFRDQCKKLGVALNTMRRAHVCIERVGDAKQWCGSYLRAGKVFRVSVDVETAGGRRVVRTREMFVAPHDPDLESRACQV